LADTDVLMASFEPGRLAFLHDVRARWRTRSWRRAPKNLPRKLDRRSAEKIGREIRSCAEGRGGDASTRARVAQLATTYVALGEDGRLAFLSMIAAELGTPEERAVEAARRILDANTSGERAEAIRAARAALEAPWVRLLTQFNTLPDGVKFLVDLRADLLSFVDDSRELRPLEQDLKHLLASWFDVGFLELQRVTWDSPASLLEKLSRSEAVHAISGWDDLKNRLDPDRRFFAFFHPRMPAEPLIFLQVALVSGLATEIAPLLDPDAPLADEVDADTAIFYSISSVQPGLAGISFGGFLIKQVVDQLKIELPRLRTFATLSPMPGFRAWLEGELASPRLQLKPDVREQLITLTEAPTLELPQESMKIPLLQLSADYLLNVKRPDGRALDAVANFHLANGSRIERINWLADTSSHGRQKALAMMVNYLYRLEDIGANHEAYTNDHAIAASSAVEQLGRAGNRLRAKS
jgi:malonyl-CoA decarboxylase